MAKENFRNALSLDEVRKALNYNPETGVFTWRHRPEHPRGWNVKFAGKVTGYTVYRGKRACRVTIRVNTVNYTAHRLAWLYVTGQWPEEQIDHINHDPTDNRFCNLRIATQQQNLWNARVHKDSRSGIKGVSKHGKKWRVRVMVNGKKFLQAFDSLEQAIACQRQIATHLHGEFAVKD